METAGTRVHDARQAIFKDGLGTRFRHDAADGPVDILVLRDAFAPIRSFEFLVRERVNRLAQQVFGRIEERYGAHYGVIRNTDARPFSRLPIGRSVAVLSTLLGHQFAGSARGSVRGRETTAR